MGSIQTQTFNTAVFNDINFSGSANITLEQSINFGVDIEAQQNIIDIIRVEVDGNTLNIFFDRCVNNSSILNITIRTNQLNAINLSGAGDFEMEDAWQGDELAITADGSWNIDVDDINYNSLGVNLLGASDLEIEGTAQTQNINIEGSNNFSGFDLVGQDVSVRIVGSGSAEVNVTGTLEVVILGSGIVAYKGSPTNISTDINGSGSVVDAN
jgi:hypothetical protein